MKNVIWALENSQTKSMQQSEHIIMKNPEEDERRFYSGFTHLYPPSAWGSAILICKEQRLSSLKPEWLQKTLMQCSNLLGDSLKMNVPFT